MGYKLNEYGLFEGEKLIPCKDEEAIYRKLGLDYIPPELREAQGEIEAAEKHELPDLIADDDIRGIFHVHTNASDGTVTAEEMARGAQAMGFEYLGIADHSRSAAYAGGLSIDEGQGAVEGDRRRSTNSSRAFAFFTGSSRTSSPTDRSIIRPRSSISSISS